MAVKEGLRPRAFFFSRVEWKTHSSWSTPNCRRGSLHSRTPSCKWGLGSECDVWWEYLTEVTSFLKQLRIITP
ncbi:hypothetical protein K0M31_018302 [Melipona bicolor]|uniref:Uncharacterized protein n=1 Tax=Melipona bicolor TaxID=60889 RepID=A0AA40G368_9HYME|nr:hypothetical protein K0M31_018302 [Melipona bicolor]